MLENRKDILNLSISKILLRAYNYAKCFEDKLLIQLVFLKSRRGERT